MEATSHYWVNLYVYLIDLEFTVCVINPIQSDAFRKMYIRQTKGDSKDSIVIAPIMRFSKFSTTSFSNEDIIVLHQLSRYHLALVDKCSD